MTDGTDWTISSTTIAVRDNQSLRGYEKLKVNERSRGLPFPFGCK